MASATPLDDEPGLPTPPPGPPDPPHGPPPAPPASPDPRIVWLIRIGLGLVVLAYIVYSSFGIAHPVLWGHYGHHAGEYMARVRMTLRFGIIAPTTNVGYEWPPVPPWYYFHHPIGYHHLLAGMTLLFGDRPLTTALLPALTGLGTLASLWTLARRRWERHWALVACAAWVSLPFICSFSILTDAMLPAMACSILMVHAFLNYLDEPRPRWLLLGCLVTIAGGLLMWEAYFQALFHGLFAIALLVTVRGRRARLGKTRWNASLAWFLATGTVAATTMAFHFLFVWKVGMLEDFFTSYRQRHSAAFDWVVARHREWLTILYGWPLLYLGLAWLAVFILRTAAGRARRRDQAVLIFFLINTLYIYLFAAGSAVHLYRVFWFSSFLALAVADLSSDLYGVLRWLVARLRPGLARPVAATVVVGALAALFAVQVPHAYANLLESRVVMGTHGLPGYNSDYPKQLFAMEVARRTGPEDFLFLHDNFPRRVEFGFYADRSSRNISTLALIPRLQEKIKRAVVLMDGNPNPSERKLMQELLKRHPGYLFDRYLMIDLRSDRPGFHEYAFEAQKPDWVWRWFVSHKYPPMRIKEVATQYGSCVAATTGVAPSPSVPEPPAPHPSRLDQVLCHHNTQVVRGRDAAAARYRTDLARQLVGTSSPLGGLGQILGLRAVQRFGAEVLVKLDKPVPAGLQWRWRLVPEPLPPPGKATVGNAPAPHTAVAIVAPPRAPAVPAAPAKRAQKLPPTVATAKPRPQSGQQPPAPVGDLSLFETRPGYLYAERLAWTAPGGGRHHLYLELAPPTPPPPTPPLPPAKAPPKPATKTPPGAKPFPIVAGRPTPPAPAVAVIPGPPPPPASPGRPVRPVPPPPPVATADLGIIDIP